MHLSPRCPLLFSSSSLDFYKKYEPIGCRDSWTLSQLTSRGVKAYFNGCLTLSLPLSSESSISPSNFQEEKKTERAVLTQKNPARVIHALDNAPSNMSEDEKCTNHMGAKIESRLSIASKLLNEYRSAEEVKTDRLHCYLPCLSFNKKVTYHGVMDERTRSLVDLSSEALLEKARQSRNIVQKWVNQFTPTETFLPDVFAHNRVSANTDVPVVTRAAGTPVPSLAVLLPTIGRPSLTRMLNSLLNQLEEQDFLYVVTDGCQYFESVSHQLAQYTFENGQTYQIVRSLKELDQWKASRSLESSLSKSQTSVQTQGRWRCTVIHIQHSTNEGHFGHGLRNIYQTHLNGDYIIHADDDDAFTESAFAGMRDQIEKARQSFCQVSRAKDPKNTTFVNPFFPPLLVFNMWHKGVIRPGKPTPPIERNNFGTPNGVLWNDPKWMGEWRAPRGGDFIFWQTVVAKIEAANEAIFWSPFVTYVVGTPKESAPFSCIQTSYPTRIARAEEVVEQK